MIDAAMGMDCHRVLRRTYLIVALVVGRFARARTAALAGTVACSVVLGAQALSWLGPRINQLAFACLFRCPCC